VSADDRANERDSWPVAPARDRSQTSPPLSGVRVLDVGTYVAGPYACALLAEFGAEVIKIEPPGGEYLRTTSALSGRHHWFTECNRGKKSITLDLKSGPDYEQFGHLVAVSDVMVHNLRPGAVEALHIDHGTLAGINPALISVQISAFGNSGPDRNRRGTATTIDAASGMAYLTGYPDGQALRPPNLYSDVSTGLFGALAAMAALRYRTMTGLGQYIDLAMLEATVHLLGIDMATASLTRELPARVGNDHWCHAPAGCYPCLGPDEWIALSIESDPQWQILSQVIGAPPWALGDDLGSAEQRWKQRRKIDLRLADWTRRHRRDELAELLVSHGLPAAAVLTPAELLSDPQLSHRGFLAMADMREYGQAPLPRTVVARARGDSILAPAPDLDEHRTDILRLGR
jgi:crotonobetainyl-CoA:carnitine CoA-transferase CaiB-like acyl-CoA transferase